MLQDYSRYMQEYSQQKKHNGIVLLLFILIMEKTSAEDRNTVSLEIIYIVEINFVWQNEKKALSKGKGYGTRNL